jgi:hypothetical protein
VSIRVDTSHSLEPVAACRTGAAPKVPTPIARIA